MFASSTLVFPTSCVCVFVCSSWCGGSAHVWRIHSNHTSVEQLGSVDAPVWGFLLRSCAQSWFLCRRLLLVYQRRESTEELQQIGDVAGIFSWLVSGEPVCTALIRLLCGGQPRLRDLGYVPADLWQATVRDLKIPPGETQRDLTALEVGHVALMRRIARLR